jgi:uncharacterized membrane protein YvbJ
MNRLIWIGETNLDCYEDGTILRFLKQTKKWRVVKGTKTSKGYLRMEIDGKHYFMHRVLAHTFGILDLDSELLIDHIDLNKSNNCISNLRPATQQQNLFNTNAKGYTWRKQKNKLEASIKLDGKSIYLGLFDTEEEAHQAYLDAKEIYHTF